MTRLVRPRVLIVTASAVAALVAALFLLVVPVTISFDNVGEGLAVNCGTALNGSPISTACPDAQSTRQVWTIALLALGAAGVVGGLVVRRKR